MNKHTFGVAKPNAGRFSLRMRIDGLDADLRQMFLQRVDILGISTERDVLQALLAAAAKDGAPALRVAGGMQMQPVAAPAAVEAESVGEARGAVEIRYREDEMIERMDGGDALAPRGLGMSCHASSLPRILCSDHSTRGGWSQRPGDISAAPLHTPS